MFLKFTRLDGSPIWLNSCFIVTVEPRRGGGATVVPIGDGLDYDVRESPEKVLELLGQPQPAPVQVQAVEALNMPSVVPVPPPKALPEKFEDVVSAGLSAPQPDEIDAKPIEIKVSPAPSDDAPVKKGTRTRKTVKAEAAEGEAKPKKATRARKTAKKAEPPMDETQVERLKRMAPGSLKKLQNTLASQFRIADVDEAVKFLLETGFLTLDQDHVTWSV